MHESVRPATFSFLLRSFPYEMIDAVERVRAGFDAPFSGRGRPERAE
jgi:hypothetical protein